MSADSIQKTHFQFSAYWIYILLAVMGCVLIAQSILIVNPAENVIVYRLGKAVATLNSGFHWVYPYPIDRVVRIPIYKGMTLVSETFRPGRSYAYASRQIPTLDPAQDAFVITSDSAILFVPTCSLVWSVDLTQRMLFFDFYNHCKSTESGLIQKQIPRCHPMLQLFVNQAIVNSASTMTAHEILAQPARFNEAVLHAVQQILTLNQCGIVAERITATVEVPFQVSANYTTTTAVVAESKRMVLESQTQAQERVEGARQEAESNVTQAQISAKKSIAESERDWVRFQHILKQYRENPEALRKYMRTETLFAILKAAQESFVLDEQTMHQLRVTLGRAPKSKPKPNPTPES